MCWWLVCPQWFCFWIKNNNKFSWGKLAYRFTDWHSVLEVGRKRLGKLYTGLQLFFLYIPGHGMMELTGFPKSISGTVFTHYTLLAIQSHQNMDLYRFLVLSSFLSAFFQRGIILVRHSLIILLQECPRKCRDILSFFFATRAKFGISFVFF